MTLYRITHVATLLLLLCSTSLFADIRLNENTTIVFASPEQGQQFLGKKDDFVTRLSPFDRASRLKTDKAVSTEQYLQFVQQQVLSFSDIDREKLSAAFGVVSKALAQYSLPFPKQVVMIKTSGKEEAGAAYTRANGIILTQTRINSTPAKLEYLLFHELFHILSRADSRLKHKLYRTIGFHQSKDLHFPDVLINRKITNPDAPINDHYIQLKHQEQLIKAVPILYSRTPNYDVKKGGEFFEYLDFKLLVVEHDLQTGVLKPSLATGNIELISVQDAPDFFAQIGQNTGYIIHPEEILADNFAFMHASGSTIKSPQITDTIKQILQEQH
jgi:hypothetical protein